VRSGGRSWGRSGGRAWGRSGIRSGMRLRKRSGLRSGESFSDDTNTISVFRGKKGNQIVYLEFFNFKLNKIKKF